jgi:2-oxoglutarate ferredoxin oxidoreductase subunit alpha
MTPVILLTDGYLANGSEPWKIPEMKDLPGIKPPYASAKDLPYLPYKRNEDNMVRYWAVAGTPDLENRIGGLEKTVKGTVSYIPENHEMMVNMRQEKVARVVEKVPDLTVNGEDSGDLLVVGWGGSYGYRVLAVNELQSEGYKVSNVTFNYINPLPRNVASVFSRFKNIIVCELNLGQFAGYLRMKFPEFNYKQINKVQGLPFTVREIKEKCIEILES